jgi:hypothetical protein
MITSVSEVYEEYCLDCLDSDGNFVMSFKEWLEDMNYSIYIPGKK